MSDTCLLSPCVTGGYNAYVSHYYRYKRGDLVRIRWGSYAGAVGVADSAMFQKTGIIPTSMQLATTWCWMTRGLLPCGGTRWRIDDRCQVANEGEFHRVAAVIPAIVVLLGKMADTKSRLSYIWSGRADLNCRPPGPKPGALPLGHAPTC